MHRVKAHLARLRGMERKKFLLGSAIVIVFTLVVVGAALMLANALQTQRVITNGTKVIVSGEVACLPHKDISGPQTLECAVGLHSDDDRFYALKDTTTSLAHDIGQRIQVTGTLSTATDSIYDIAGTIAVTQITR